MNSRDLNSAKELFLDIVDAQDYVSLDRPSLQYEQLKKSIVKPIKMALLYGEPGTGKSMLLEKLHDELSVDYPIYLLNTPQIEEKDFFTSLSGHIFSLEDSRSITFAEFNKMLTKIEFNQIPIILLDEAQLYPENIMENIRLLADTRKIKFVVSLHNTKREHITAKEYFQTRIWETIELINANPAELQHYIQKKLLRQNLLNIADIFTNELVRHIYKYTKGNYRNSNKLLYSLFEILYMQNRDIGSSKKLQINKKSVMLAAIKARFILANDSIDKGNLSALENIYSKYRLKKHLPYYIASTLISFAIFGYLLSTYHNEQLKVQIDISSQNNDSKIETSIIPIESKKIPKELKERESKVALVNSQKSDNRQLAQPLKVERNGAKSNLVKLETSDSNSSTLNAKTENQKKEADVVDSRAIFYPSMKFVEKKDSRSTLKREPKLVKKISSIVKKSKKEQKSSEDTRSKPEILLSKNAKLKNVIERFGHTKTPELGLFIAQSFYKESYFKSSYKYAILTNDLDINLEESWIIAAKSLVKLGDTKRAIYILDSYIKQSKSARASILKSLIKSGKFK